MLNKHLHAMAITMAFTAGGIAVTAAPTNIFAEGLNKSTSQEQRVADVKYSAEVTKYFNELNKVRKAAGASELVQDPHLMKSAQDHANFLNKNGHTLTTGHDQDPSKPGFTGVTPKDRYVNVGGDLKKFDGIVSEVTATGRSIQGAFEGLLESTAHRQHMLRLGNDTVGVGISGNSLVYVLANDENIPYDRNLTIKYPYNGQANVDTAYDLEQVSSSPLTYYGAKISGYVISFTTYNSQYGTNYNIKLVDSNGVRVQTLNDMNQADGPGSFFYIIPKNELKQGEKYTATATWVDDDDNQKSETWSFTTEGTNGSTTSRPSKDPHQFPTSVAGFDDYNPNKYWAKDFEWAIENKLINGYQYYKNSKTAELGNLLKPDTNLTETQMLSLLFRYFVKEELESTKPTGSWEHNVNYQLAAKFNLPVLASSTPKEQDLASNPITRGNFARILVTMHYNTPVSQADAIKFLHDNGITTAKTAKDFQANAPLTRAHAVTFFHRYEQEIGSNK